MTPRQIFRRGMLAGIAPLLVVVGLEQLLAARDLFYSIMFLVGLYDLYQGFCCWRAL